MHKYWIGSIFALVLASISPIALAQDSSPPTVHGFDDLAFKNDYLTPRGLLVTNKGLTIQILNGFVAPVYSSASGPISDVSLVTGVWNDLNPGHQNAPTYNEFDAFGGINFSIYKDWIAGIQYVAFISPPGNFKTEHNVEFSLRYEDNMRWLSPISVNPMQNYSLPPPAVRRWCSARSRALMSSSVSCRPGTSIPMKHRSS